MHQRPIKVLLVESDRGYLDELRDRLGDARSGAGIDLEWAGELSGALERLSHGGIDAILLGLDLPDSEGMVTFERTHAFAWDVPIIVLTDVADENLGMTTVQGGAQDFLVKEEMASSVLSRTVRHAIERHRLLGALRSLSLIDDLTGLYNRRGFTDLGEQYLKLARRTTRGVTLVFLDLDRFKAINDSLGHHVGDRALLKVAEILRATFRRSDLVARLGGDEFAVLALEASDESPDLLVSRLRERFQEFDDSGSEPFELSASIGVARHDEDLRIRLEDLLSEADAAMYDEKRDKRKVALG